MKSIKMLLCCLLIYGSTFATNSPTSPLSDCRLAYTIALPFGNEMDLIENDLLNGIWKEDFDRQNIISGMERIMQFNDFGLLDMVTVYGNGYTAYENHQWCLEALGNHVYLVIFDRTLGEDLIYEITQSCEGVQLTDIDNNDVKLLYHSPKKSERALMHMRQNLIGQWQQVGYPFDIIDDLSKDGTFEEMDDAYLQYTFNADGTYTMALGSKMVDLKEQGFWEITDDGKYLAFHVSRDGSAEQVYTSRYISILKMEFEELQLEQAITTPVLGELFNTRMKSFTFEKTEIQEG